MQSAFKLKPASTLLAVSFF